MNEIVPKINISKLIINGLNSSKSNKVIKQIKKACLDVGFFTIVGHGISIKLINSALITTKKFFNLPIHKKLKVAPLRWNKNNSNIYICECDYSSLRTLVFGLRLNLILKDSLKARGKDNLLSAPELLENPKVLNFLASMRQKHKKRLKDAKHLVTTVTKVFEYEKESGEEYDEFIQLFEELVGIKFPFDDSKDE